MRLVSYNMAQGASKNAELRARLLQSLKPDLLFMQESPDPAYSWLPALQGARKTNKGSCLWRAIPGRRWGSGIWLKKGSLTELAVPEEYTGRVIAALVEGWRWPTSYDVTEEAPVDRPVVVLSIHAPAPKGSTYIKEVGYIADFARDLAGGLPLILAGDFNVAVGMRRPDHRLKVSRDNYDWLQKLRDELQLVPAWQTLHPNKPLIRTLRWMRRLDSLPYHCDGVFVPASWAHALRSCTVPESSDWCALSDHNPVVATLAVPRRANATHSEAPAIM